MEIHFKNIDGRNVAQALVDIPSQVLNHFPIRTTDQDSYLNIPHVKNGAFTRIMGDASISFTEQGDQLPIPDNTHKGIYVGTLSEFITTTEGTLIKLGFEKRGPAKWWCPFFGADSEENWMDFDPQTDKLSYIIAKLFRSGYAKGRREVRLEIKKALDISPT